MLTSGVVLEKKKWFTITVTKSQFNLMIFSHSISGETSLQEYFVSEKQKSNTNTEWINYIATLST